MRNEAKFQFNMKYSINIKLQTNNFSLPIAIFGTICRSAM